MTGSALAALVACALAAPDSLPPPSPRIYLGKDAQFLLGVRTEPAARKRLSPRLVSPGRVVPRPDKRAQVLAPSTGRLWPSGERLPRLGETVKKGQVLGLFEQSLSTPESAQLSAERIRAESAASRAQAALEQARRDLARVRELSSLVAQKDVQQSELALKVAEDEAARAQRERELYAGGPREKGRLTQLPLVAPLDGVLAEVRATAGESVEAARPLFVVLDASVVWVEASLFAADLPRVGEAPEGAVRDGDAWLAARLVALGQAADEATRSVKAVFEVANAERRLRPGTFVDVALVAGSAESTLAVPEAAVVTVDGRPVVFVHVAPEDFEVRAVLLGARDGALRGVVQGLAEGERVVVQGTYFLRESEAR